MLSYPLQFLLQAAAKKEETVAILEEFKNSPLRPLLIISYEQFRIHASFLQSVAGVDLIICDEVQASLRTHGFTHRVLRHGRV